MTTPTPPAQPDNLASIPDFSAGAKAVKTVDASHEVTPPKSNKGGVKKRDHVNYKGQRLTPKQAKFVKGVASGKPQTVAALEAYDTDSYNVASAIAVENLEKPSVRDALDAALAKAGITIEAAIEPIQDALAFEDPDGDQRTQIDMRLKGSDRALKLMGAMQQEKDPGGAGTINFNIGNMFVKKGDA